MSESTGKAPLAASSTQREVKWIEGLRGLACTFIVTSHLARGYWSTVISPAQSDQALGSIFHLPILRLPSIGQPWVAIFLTLTGYVIALKPIRQARSGNVPKALSDLTAAALRRPARLILPTTIITIVIWIMAQLGAFGMGKLSGVGGVADTSPQASDSVGRAFHDLFYNMFTTWSASENFYDHHQWAMMYILLGSMMVFLTLVATIRCSPLTRASIFIGLYAFNWAKFEPLYMNTYGGAALAEFGIYVSTSHTRQLDRLPFRIFSYLLIYLGLFFLGCPEGNYEWTTWSHTLYKIGFVIFPSKTTYQSDYWSSIGTQILIIGLACAPSAQRLLSHPALLWLGSISLPVYLLHGPLMRSVLIWMMFGWGTVEKHSKTEEDVSVTEWESIPWPPSWMPYLCIPIFFVILFAVSHAWNVYVEPWCALVTNRIAEWMSRQGPDCRQEMAEHEAKEILLMGQV